MLATRTCRFALVLILATLAGVASARDWFAERGVRAPAGGRVYICHGYGCRIVTPVQLSAADIGEIAKPLTGSKDAAAERQALARAVQIFESLVGRRAGTGGDLAKMQFGQQKAGQMDCLDEATNTTSLLRVLAEHGHLKHHRVERPASRGFFLDGRYPHATAVIGESAGGDRWAVDSWPNANGEPPVVMPLAAWARDRGGEEAS